MKLSKFIKELQKIEKKHGDIEVKVFTSTGEGDTEEPNIVFGWDYDKNKVSEINICDWSWADAFVD